MAERANGRSEVLEDLQVLLRHGGVFLPVVLRVHVKVWSVALVGDFGNNGRLWEQCEILRGSVCRRTEGKKKKTPTRRYLSHVTGIPGVETSPSVSSEEPRPSQSSWTIGASWCRLLHSDGETQRYRRWAMIEAQVQQNMQQNGHEGLFVKLILQVI